MKKFAIIVAGGSGTRMGSRIPKQFMLLKNKPLLYYPLQTFLNAFDDLQIILCLPAGYIDMGQQIVDTYFDTGRIRITAGGDTRFQSVKNGLTLVQEESIIFVHDGARCLPTKELIHRCYECALEKGSAIPVIPSKDSVRLITKQGNESYERNNVMLVQTPQTFHSKILLAAYQVDYRENFTDEATVVEAYGLSVSLVEGEEENIKITRPLDLIIAENILTQRQVGY